MFRRSKATDRTAAKTRRRGGFTLTEILLVTTILGFLSLGIYQFTIDSTVGMFVSSEKLQINRDIRYLTGRLIDSARSANEFTIYPSFRPSDRDSKADQLVDGESGDFLLLIYLIRDEITLEEKYKGFVGYFRRPSAGDNSGPVYRFEEFYEDGDEKPIADYNGPEDLLGGLSFSAEYSEVIELARSEADQSLFYNFNNDSIMVKAEILHGNDAKRVTDTYNFTISPRN